MKQINKAKELMIEIRIKFYAHIQFLTCRIFFSLNRLWSIVACICIACRIIDNNVFHKKKNKFNLLIHATNLYTCFGSLEKVGVVDGFALRSRGCSVGVSSGLGDGLADGLADEDSAAAFACI